MLLTLLGVHILFVTKSLQREKEIEKEEQKVREWMWNTINFIIHYSFVDEGELT